MRLVLALLASALPALAQQSELVGEPLSADAFDRMSMNRTLVFSDRWTGAPIGEETYLPGRQTYWVRADGTCAEGVWYEEDDGAICFVYDDSPGPHCWFLRRQGKQILVINKGGPGEFDQEVTGTSNTPLSCTPDLIG